MAQLYGDGLHDDTAAIQKRISRLSLTDCLVGDDEMIVNEGIIGLQSIR